jgi:hypothetical protein
MGVPYKPPREKKSRSITVGLTESVFAALKRVAEKDGRKLSNLADRAIRQWLSLRSSIPELDQVRSNSERARDEWDAQEIVGRAGADEPKRLN